MTSSVRRKEEDVEHGIREEDDLIFNFFFVSTPLFFCIGAKLFFLPFLPLCIHI